MSHGMILSLARLLSRLDVFLHVSRVRRLGLSHCCCPCCGQDGRKPLGCSGEKIKSKKEPVELAGPYPTMQAEESRP